MYFNANLMSFKLLLHLQWNPIKQINLFILSLFLVFTVHSVVKDSQNVRETKDKQITELRKMVEETTEQRKNDFEKKVA